jgi:hypothetical protein
MLNQESVESSSSGSISRPGINARLKEIVSSSFEGLSLPRSLKNVSIAGFIFSTRPSDVEFGERYR